MCKISTLFIFIFCSTALLAQTSVCGKVLESGSRLPLAGAVVSTETGIWCVTDTTGSFVLRFPKEKKADKEITITLLGYYTLKTSLIAKGGIYLLQQDIQKIDEVVVTAIENRGTTSISRIGKEAIAHIQPSSIADVLELLPGGYSKDPVLGSPQLVNLRSAHVTTNSDYATSALGTRFIIDGRPAMNDANLQQTPAWSSLGSSFVNAGTDMREISTEDIENVEIVRGIASVEYGDLTSGVIKIQRKKGGNDLRFRFKADMKSKLFYTGKGFEWGNIGDKATMNLSLNYLDSQSDPRNSRQNWKRITGSWRFGKTKTGDRLKGSFNANLDYTGSFDNQKSDYDLDIAEGGGPLETYKSSYNKFCLGTDFTLSSLSQNSFFRSWRTFFSISAENDIIDRWKHVSTGQESIVSISRESGDFDAIIIPSSYNTTLRVEGKPLYLNFYSILNFKRGIHRIKAGAEWTYDKNYGAGAVFDVTRPLSSVGSTRPRPFYEIPGTHLLSAFVEDAIKKELGEWAFAGTVGIRMETMSGAGSKYEVNLKPYFDPRANIRIEFPSLLVKGYKFDWAVYGGAGKHTKFPTMDQLFPAPVYADILQFNYWPVEKELRRMNMRVYKIDPTNYALAPARNLKMETGFDASWNGFTFSINFFKEDMSSGFRNASKYMSLMFKDYDEGQVDKSTLTGPPDISSLAWRQDTLLTAHGYTSNGSRTYKRGIEFTLSTKRIRAINTKINLSGAWFLTDYMNSQNEYWVPTVTIGGERYPYVGLYKVNDGNCFERLSSNLMFDTQIPLLGLVFTTSFQTTWYTKQSTMQRSKAPVAYIDKKLTEKPFTEESAQDPILRHMLRDFSEFEYKIPFATNINLKATKKLFQDKLSLSLFVNRIFNITPDYMFNGFLVRRNTTPYFGMELHFNI